MLTKLAILGHFLTEWEQMIKSILCLIFAVLLGYSLTHIPWIYIPVIWQVWLGVAICSFIGIVICLFLSRKPKEKVSSQKDASLEIKARMQKLEKEFKQAIRGHLKVSIIFWTYFYKKEKVKTFEEAKKEVLQDLKKEFPKMPWMESMLEEIRQELIKYK